MRGGEATVDQHRVGAEHGGGDDRLDQPVVVAAEHPDPVAGLHAEPGPHRPGQPLGPGEQLLVGQFGTLLVDDGDPARVAGGGLAQLAGEAPTPLAQRLELGGDPDRPARGEQPPPGQRGHDERQVHVAASFGVR